VERSVQKRPWYERLVDRDNPAAPLILVILLVLVVGMVCSIGPLLDRWIEGKQPESHFVSPARPAML
jgi:hypothetical protein